MIKIERDMLQIREEMNEIQSQIGKLQRKLMLLQQELNSQRSKYSYYKYSSDVDDRYIMFANGSVIEVVKSEDNIRGKGYHFGD